MTYFRAAWDSGFKDIMGDDGDMRLVAFINEHWFRVLHGQESWRNMPFFYPVKDLLGWSDAFFVYQVFFAPLREMGCGPVLALQLTTVCMSAVGYISFYFLARAWLRAPQLIASAGAAVFTFGNDLYVHSATEQLAGMYFIPPLLLLGRWAWLKHSKVLGATAGMLFGLVFFTTYYMAAFAVLAAVIALVWGLLLRPGYTWGWVRSLPAGLVAAATAGFVIAMIPVADVYLPAHAAIGSVGYSTIIFYSIDWKVLADVGPGNMLWGSVLGRLYRSDTLTSSDASNSVTPLLMLTALAGGLWATRRLRSAAVREPRRAAAETSGACVWVVLIAALTSLTLMTLPVRVFGRPPWLAVWLVPGFDAIRAIDRVEVLAGGLASLVLVALASELWERTGGQRRSLVRLGVAVAVGLIVFEQLNTAEVTLISRPAQDRLLASVRTPPTGCRYFYVVDAAHPKLPFYESQVDAMFIAERAGIPTINGYTGYNPRGWDLESIGAAGYLGAVRSWESQEHLPYSGACQLDLGTMRWTPGV